MKSSWGLSLEDLEDPWGLSLENRMSLIVQSKFTAADKL